GRNRQNESKGDDREQTLHDGRRAGTPRSKTDAARFAPANYSQQTPTLSAFAPTSPTATAFRQTSPASRTPRTAAVCSPTFNETVLSAAIGNLLESPAAQAAQRHQAAPVGHFRHCLRAGSLPPPEPTAILSQLLFH